jgi:serine/threonine-protein kinase MRCK
MPFQLTQARDKIDASRLESFTDSEETIAELCKRHEREKNMLLNELDLTRENNRRMQNERLQMENDYDELRYVKTNHTA